MLNPYLPLLYQLIPGHCTQHSPKTILLRRNQTRRFLSKYCIFCRAILSIHTWECPYLQNSSSSYPMLCYFGVAPFNLLLSKHVSFVKMTSRYYEKEAFCPASPNLLLFAHQCIFKAFKSLIDLDRNTGCLSGYYPISSFIMPSLCIKNSGFAPCWLALVLFKILNSRQ